MSRRTVRRRCGRSTMSAAGTATVLATLLAAPTFAAAKADSEIPAGTAPRTVAALSDDQLSGDQLSGDQLSGDQLSGDQPSAPPGVEASVLRNRASDEDARRPLAEMLPPPPFIERVEPPVATAPEDATRSYVRGREALLEGRTLVAVTELERAHAADPGSVEVLRQLARALGAAGGAARSFESYMRLLELDPDDPEALFSVGLSLVNQRSFAQALPPLLALRHAIETDPGPVLDELGDDAPIVVSFALFMALRQVGHDRAAIEAVGIALDTPLAAASSRPTPLRSRAEEVLRQRAETWRQVGDAWCRLGDAPEALRAYQRATGTAAPDETAMLARRLFVRLWLGEHRAAADELVAHVAGDPARVTRQEAAIAGWLARNLPDPLPLATSLRRLADAHPEHPSLLWTAAGAAPPDEAAAILRAYLAERPRDMAVIAELLFELSVVRLDLAVALAVELVDATPADAEQIVERLVAVRATPAELRATFETLPPSPARSATQAWVMAVLRAPGAGWTIVDEALRAHQESSLLHATRIAMAGTLEELSLVDDSVAAARRSGAWSRHAALAEIEARLRCRQWERAEGVAADLAVIAGDDGDALAAAAMASLMHALALPEQSALRSSAADESLRSAMAAIEVDPTRQRAWEAIIRLHDPRSGLVPDVQRLRETIARLQSIDPESPLLLRLVAAEEIGRGRVEQAIERLVALWERQPADDELVRLLLQAWARQGRLADAEVWFRDRLERSPSSPRLADALMTVLVQGERADEAIALLRARIETDPEDGVALWLLETALRTTGSPEATSLARARLGCRPAGPRRDVELASLAIDDGDSAGARALLEGLLVEAGRLSVEQMVLALSVTERLDESAASDRVRLSLARAALRRDPDAPMIAHGLAIVAAARLERGAREGVSEAVAGGRVDLATIDELIETLVRSVPGRAVGSEAASQWAVLAQRLVNADRADIAARAVRRRHADAILQDRQFATAMSTLAVTADIGAGDVEAAIGTLRLVAEHRATLGWPPTTAGPEPPALTADAQSATLADVLVWASIRWTLLGRAEGAEALLREAVRLDPHHAMARNNLGYALLERSAAAGRAPDRETITLIESAHAAGPDDASIVDSIGWLRYLQGRIDGEDGAVALLERAVRLSGADASPEILEHLGDALWRADRVEEARSQWESAAAMIELEYPADRMVQRLTALMTQDHGLIVQSPAAIWERLYGAPLGRLRARLDAVGAGVPPPVTPIAASE